ncbi:GAF domain-containing protein, partial [bacterium]|nr:GAF domain-containing protein [bacterium]
VGLPLITGQRVLGAIFVFREYSGFSSDDKSLLSSFANQAAIAVKNAQLYAQVEYDRKRVTALLDSAADGILILTSDLTVERANPAFSFMIGAPVQDIIAKNHDEIIQWAKKPHDMTLSEAVAGGWPLTPNATLYVEGDIIRPGQLRHCQWGSPTPRC